MWISFFFKECTFRGKRICIFRGKKKKCPANFYRLKVWYHESFIFSDTTSRSPVGASFENFQPVDITKAMLMENKNKIEENSRKFKN